MDFTKKERQMNHQEAMSKATQIAKTIMVGARKLRVSKISDLPLLANLPLMSISSGRIHPDQLTPIIDESLVFGSVARGEEEVNDVDMIILDRGFYSTFFLGLNKKHPDRYLILGENLDQLLTGWFGFDKSIFTEELATPTDLHVLPVDILRNQNTRTRIGRKHHDPRFFQNAFSALLRFDQHLKVFEKTDIAALEKKYSFKGDTT